MALAKGPQDFICSARECEEPATEAIQWRNPKIHTGRYKTWMACPAHIEHLVQYLAYRNFPCTRIPLEEYRSALDAD